MKNSDKSQIEKLNQKLGLPRNDKFVLEMLLEIMKIRAEYLNNCLEKYQLQIQLLGERFYRNELTIDMLNTYQQSLIRDLDKLRSQVSSDSINVQSCEHYIKEIYSSAKPIDSK